MEYLQCNARPDLHEAKLPFPILGNMDYLRCNVRPDLPEAELQFDMCNVRQDLPEAELLQFDIDAAFYNVSMHVEAKLQLDLKEAYTPARQPSPTRIPLNGEVHH
jgi:hypothetical protein